MLHCRFMLFISLSRMYAPWSPIRDYVILVNLYYSITSLMLSLNALCFIFPRDLPWTCAGNRVWYLEGTSPQILSEDHNMFGSAVCYSTGCYHISLCRLWVQAQLKHNFKTTISKPLETMYTFDLHSTNNNRTRSRNALWCDCLFMVICITDKAFSNAEESPLLANLTEQSKYLQLEFDACWTQRHIFENGHSKDLKRSCLKQITWGHELTWTKTEM